MNGMKVKIFSVIAVAVMVACAFIPVVNGNPSDNGQNEQGLNASAKQTFKYVSIGDSMTTGYGLGYDGMEDGYTGYYTADDDGTLTNPRGFLKDVTGSYPTLLTEFLNEELSWYGYDVEHVQLGLSAARSVDLRAIMYGDDFTGSDDIPGDGYTKAKFFEGNDNIWAYEAAILEYEELAEERGLTGIPEEITNEWRANAFGLLGDIYKQELSDADLITYNSHYDFGRVLGEISDMLAGGSVWKEIDYGLYFGDEYMSLAEETEKATMEYLVDKVTLMIADLDAETASKYLQMVSNAAKIIAYSLVSYCFDYYAIIKYIDNISTQRMGVFVINAYDQFNEISMNFYGLTISFTGLYDRLLYIAKEFISHDYFYYNHVDVFPVIVNSHTELIGDEFINRSPSDIAKASLMHAIDPDTYDFSTVENYEGAVADYEKLDEGGFMTAFMNAIFSMTCLDVGTLLSGIGTVDLKFENMLLLLYEGAVTSTEFSDLDGFTVHCGENSITFNTAELFILYIKLTKSGEALLAHPNSNGQYLVFETLARYIYDIMF